VNRSLRWILVVILSVAGVWAQAQTARGFPVRGEIVSTSGTAGSLTIELSAQGGGIWENVSVNPDGTFEIRSIAPGTYDLRVIAFGGQIIHQEMVSITGSPQTLSIRLPELATGNASRSTGSTISFAQLQHKIPAQAQKLFNKGEQAFAKHNLPQAADYYRQAIALDAEFVDAYIQLGAAEAALGQLPEAAEQYQKVIDIAPEHQLALPNLSIVLAKMKRFREAGEVARRALKVVPGSGRVHYILAASLLEEDGNLDEAIEHMERATSEVPRAHLVASDLLLRRGRRDAAIRHLEEYLLVAPATDAMRIKVEAHLSELQH
jgi:tetratricopeptide (TPR) repeat protein